MKTKTSLLILQILFLLGLAAVACNLPTAVQQGAYSDEGVEESLFLIEEIRVEPLVGLTGTEFTLVIEDYDYFDDGDGGANSVECWHQHGKIGAFDGDDFRKDENGDYLKEMSYEDRFTRSFQITFAPFVEWEAECHNPGLTVVANFQVLTGFFVSDCEDSFAMDAGLELWPDSSRASNSELSCKWANGETTSAAVKIEIARVWEPEQQDPTFNRLVDSARNVSSYCKVDPTPMPGVQCSCDEAETSEAGRYRRLRTGGCTYDSGLVTNDYEIEEVLIYRDMFFIYVSSQEHRSDSLLYPNMHDAAVTLAKALINERYPLE